MYTCQKKIPALGLVLLLAIPLLFSVITIVRQKVLQINSRLRFDTEKTETISISKQNINWVKKGKEVLIDGKYFDVKSFKTEGDIIALTGYYDHKEDKLVNHIKKIFQQNKDSNFPVDQTASKFLFFPIYSNHTEIYYLLCWHAISNQFFSFAEKLPPAPNLPITQPPEL
jgi:hypothetical protein